MRNSQLAYDLRCEWGERGVESLAPEADVVVLVDVLSFCTCLDVANSRGALVFPCRLGDEGAFRLAGEVGARLAGRRSEGGLSLSPVSLLALRDGDRLVLPSPNGSALSLLAGGTPTLGGCLRNARAVARAARGLGRRIAVIPAGERWPDGSLRPALEDWLGAGAILRHLAAPEEASPSPEAASPEAPLAPSPEATAAAEAYRAAVTALPAWIRASVSGCELVEAGFGADVDLACREEASATVPRLRRAGSRVAYVGWGLEISTDDWV